MQIWAHTLVRNEERYLWFAVGSVISYVDKLLLWDTGSTDKTVKIIKLLKNRYPGKIQTRFAGEVTPSEYTNLRQEMLEVTKSDWFIIVDGDEVWWNSGINELTSIIYKAKNKFDSIVNGYYNVVGDIYHYQEKEGGMYEIDGVRGHITIRAINRNIPGLYTSKPHGQHGYYDEDGVLVQDRISQRRYHLSEKTYIHFTNVVRSVNQKEDSLVPKRGNKLKYELGVPFTKDFYYPEVFFEDKSDIIPSPWVSFDKQFLLRSMIETPLRKIKRRIAKSKVGY